MLEVQGYHAHVYFDAASEARALALRTALCAALPVTGGHINRRPRGPHPTWSLELVFAEADLSAVLGWLLRHRDGLTVLVHPLTSAGDLVDHTDHALWLGAPLELALSALG